jgi:hypothetical protein
MLPSVVWNTEISQWELLHRGIRRRAKPLSCDAVRRLVAERIDDLPADGLETLRVDMEERIKHLDNIRERWIAEGPGIASPTAENGEKQRDLDRVHGRAVEGALNEMRYMALALRAIETVQVERLRAAG